MDNKDLVAGTTLYLPVFNKGALFEAGDGHAAQGHGEVDVTALETSLTGTFQFIVRKDLKTAYPRAETPTHYIAMGFDEDLWVATRRPCARWSTSCSRDKHLLRRRPPTHAGLRRRDLSITARWWTAKTRPSPHVDPEGGVQREIARAHRPANAVQLADGKVSGLLDRRDVGPHSGTTTRRTPARPPPPAARPDRDGAVRRRPKKICVGTVAAASRSGK
jgi:hypothetical protein